MFIPSIHDFIEYETHLSSHANLRRFVAPAIPPSYRYDKMPIMIDGISKF